MLQAGRITGRVFSAWATNYHVFKIKLRHHPECEAVYRGSNPPVIRDDEYMFSGRWWHSEHYGKQFQLKSWELMTDYDRTRTSYLSAIRHSLDHPDLFKPQEAT